MECCVCGCAFCYSQHFDLKREFPGDKAEYLKVREAASGGVFVVSGGGGGERVSEVGSHTVGTWYVYMTSTVTVSPESHDLTYQHTHWSYVT